MEQKTINKKFKCVEGPSFAFSSAPYFALTPAMKLMTGVRHGVIKIVIKSFLIFHII